MNFVSKSNGGLANGRSYFDSVTGSNEYERQSWRDSYNHGRAAGDVTGNTNARIEAEREAFQGTTWTGSSSQPSALELARSFVGPGYASGTTGAASHVGGAGQAQVVMGGPASAAGGGAGQRVVVSGAPLTTKVKGDATGGWAGLNVLPNPWFSDVENWWEPRFGEPGEWLGGIVNIGADGVFNAGRALDWATGSNTVAGRKGEHVSLERQLEMPGHLDAFERQFSTWDRQLHGVFGSGPYVGGGF